MKTETVAPAVAEAVMTTPPAQVVQQAKIVQPAQPIAQAKQDQPSQQTALDSQAFSAAPKPFGQLKVLDFSRYLPGGYCTQVLADLGAEVIKVEDTSGGDFCRYEYPTRHGVSYYITALGRNKKSVSLNLKNKEAVAAFHAMAKDADVIVESFRPGVTKKLGVDYDTIKQFNPGIIYVSISGYGSKDPRSKKASHDLNMQAASGFLDLNDCRLIPIPLVDAATHAVATQSVLAALAQRNATGEGAYVDVSMFNCFLWWNSLLDSRWCFNGGQCYRQDLEYPCTAYNVYETKDGGHLAFGMVEDKFWNGFCNAVDRPDLIPAHLARKWENPQAFEDTAAIVASKTAKEWGEWLADKDFCIEVVLPKNEAIDRIVHDQPDMMRYVDFPRVGRVLQTSIPHDVSSIDTKCTEFVACSDLGSDTEEVLTGLGMSKKEVKRMADEGAVFLGNDKEVLEDFVPRYAPRG